MNEWKTRPRPRLLTAALRLRPFTLDDAAAVQQLAGDERIADTTMNVPHPYEDGMAEEWIATHEPQFRKGRLVNFAMANRETDELVGMIGMVVQVGGHAAEIGYWVGAPFWGRGFTTEAGARCCATASTAWACTASMPLT